MKKILLWGICITIMLTGSAYSENTGNLTVEVMANNNVLTSDVGFLGLSPYGTVATSVGLAYDENDYTIGHGSVALQSEDMIPGMRYGLGFKYVNGSAKKSGRSRADLSSLGFLFRLDYELPGESNPVNIPIELAVEAVVSPGSLSFQDTDSYQEYAAMARFYMLENAYFSIKYAYRDIDFDTSGDDWSRVDHLATVGIALKF